METKYIDEINTIERIIDRSKDVNIFYMTEDTILNTEAVKKIANKIEQLEKENVSKQKAYDNCYCEFKHYKQFDSIPKSVIRDKIDFYKRYGKIEKLDEYVCRNICSVLQEILGEE